MVFKEDTASTSTDAPSQILKPADYTDQKTLTNVMGTTQIAQTVHRLILSLQNRNPEL